MYIYILCVCIYVYIVVLSIVRLLYKYLYRYKFIHTGKCFPVPYRTECIMTVSANFDAK